MPVYVLLFIYLYHSGNFTTRNSHSGILLFVNNALIKYFCNHQNISESSTFRSELFSLRIARDMIVEIRIKFKFLGSPWMVHKIYSVMTMGLGIKQESLNPNSPRNKTRSTTTVCVRQM